MVEEKVQPNSGIVFEREIPMGRDWIRLSLENKRGHWVLYRERRQWEGATIRSVFPIRSLKHLSAFAAADEFSSQLDKAYADILATVRASPSPCW
ncbi:hypothetical protein [Burkholderia cepacia]|uniref:hypothetical protein n=1 Tax=Burkholderia cepacia TaxID=292 RepID=UPI002AB6BD25|nr:hypothetical protein [Burkholderia cepacia]